MGGICLLIDLLTKSIFPRVILSMNFKILFPDKVGLSEITGFWNSWYIVLSSEE